MRAVAARATTTVATEVAVGTLSGCTSGDAPSGANRSSAATTSAMSAPSPGSPPTPDTSAPSGAHTMTIHITAGDHVVTADLDDTPAAAAFAAILPLEVTISDFHATEKVADLPGRLPTDDEPAGYEPSTGDLTYYAPWGNLAIFYRDFDYATGLVRLGRITSDTGVLGDLAGPASITASPP